MSKDWEICSGSRLRGGGFALLATVVEQIAMVVEIGLVEGEGGGVPILEAVSPCGLALMPPDLFWALSDCGQHFH